MANKSRGASATAQAVNYKNSKRWETNRLRKLTQQLKLNPTNAKQIETAIGNIHYRRKTPKAATWSKTRIKIASLYREFTGRFNLEIFSNNEKIALPALTSAGTKSVRLTDKELALLPHYKGSMFSIGAQLAAKARSLNE